MTACASASLTALPAVDLLCSVGGARLRYRDEGRGPALLLLHGWTLDLEMWTPQLAALRQHFRLIRFDRRGHGRSTGVPCSERDGADLAALCAHLGLGRVALLGMSQGARVALRFAADAPERVSVLILDGPPALHSDPEAELPIGQLTGLYRTHGIEAVRRQWARHPLMQLRTHDPDMHALLAAMIERYAGNDLRPGATALAPAVGVRLAAVTAPTLVVCGADDLPGRRRAASELGAQLAHAQLALIEGAGHLPNLDRPHRYSELCRRFLSAHLSPRDNSRG